MPLMLSEVHSTRRGTRRNALNKLAALSAQTVAGQDGGEDIERLRTLSRRKNREAPNGSSDGMGRRVQTFSIPMSVRELEVLVALSRAAPLLQTTKDAAGLLNQLVPYLPEVHRQNLSHPPLYQHLPPWETLSFDLTCAVLAIGLNHPSLRPQALSCVYEGFEELTKSAEEAAWTSPAPSQGEVSRTSMVERLLPAIQLTVSLLGFLRAIAKYVQVYDPDQRMSMIQKVRYLLSEKFMVSMEGALSAVRNSRSNSQAAKEWRRWVKHYATRGTPLGAMLLQQAFMNIVEESVILLLSPHERLSSIELLDVLLHRKPLVDHTTLAISDVMVEDLTDVIVEEIALLEADADYLKVSSAWQQRLALEVKASCLRSYLCCSLLNEDIADDELLLSWFEAITSDSVQMADEHLAKTALQSMAVLARTSSATASNLSRSIPRLIVNGKMPPHIARFAGECLALVLRRLSQDMVISTLYSLGNVLSAGNDKTAGASPFFDGTNNANGSPTPYASQQALGSQLSLVFSDEGETTTAYGSIVEAIVSIATVCNDEKITALVLSMLVQKIGRISAPVDARIISETAALGLSGGLNQLRALVRLYARIASESTVQQDSIIMNAVMDARVRLATWIKKDSPLYEPYLMHLLDLGVSSGDTAGERTVDVKLATETISHLIRPTAILASNDTEHLPEFENENAVLQLSRDAWFNLVVHGFTLDSDATNEYAEELQLLASYSLPLVDEERVDMPESGIDLNMVLRRGESPQRTIEQKSTLISGLPHCEHDIKGLSYPDCVFLNAAFLVSTFRARSGDCTAVLSYFLENKVKKTDMGTVMLAIAQKSVDTYLDRALSGQRQEFAASQVALQLVAFFEGACHRIPKVQHAAVSAADRIINQIPSALCQKASLFGLLELLTLMWKSCLDVETNEYEWRATYTSEKGNVSIQISDDLYYRQTTLTNFHKRCRLWVSKAIDVAPLDVKGLLQAYLEDYEDDGSYGHIALGRSFAVEMGSMIPITDQRLTSLDRQKDFDVNTASDFIAQYTTRQEYRNVDGKLGADEDWLLVDYPGTGQPIAMEPELAGVEEAKHLRALAQRLWNHESVSFSEIRETLRDAAGVLSKSASDSTPLISDLVGIPFTVFTKQSINLGISLWLGVVKENPSLESRILVEVAAGWEASVRLKKGFFNSAYQHLDPFYVKEEFAPSQWDAISRRQQLIQNLIAPHLRLTHLLASHFSASRLIAPSIEHVYGRLMRITMLAMRHTLSHPLAREVHFQIVLLALKVLRYSAHMRSATRWRLKDAILSAGLAWFSTPPRWSFGSNRLQVKAEVKLLNDVSNMIRESSPIGARAGRSLASLQPKQELLQNFLGQEITRLGVWISPLGLESRGLIPLNNVSGTIRDSDFSPLLQAAWAEDPRIVVQLATRFPTSQKLIAEIRSYLLKQPEKVIVESDALYTLLGSSLPDNVKVQLKYLLFWAPINPMAAVTYFLPAYGNHPFIIQYAMRALESHSVDVTFFYVPQVVQALRYDALGYVERYIIEAAKFSQLFAHQIIWNMKANSYKDEESEEPDPVKPTLDRVMDSLISSFSGEDRDFYEREFDFFGKVTGISGTLKPLIKRPKSEKKQKIEEELRKIQVDAGVYLPSNPDGVVIGIDRKSGKPLQSHAKAPFMATFRIRKEGEVDPTENQGVPNGEVSKRRTYEVWQSAIFKVGDDCRQDILALQLIAAFRGIFNTVGLDVYIFPYRVTATAPGCGVIDVLPNSISRDMLGREAVNGLYEYFISKYGYEDSIRFQEARGNFIKSMAAYSIISFLLQFKDRHNGNIMIDDAGHILHIDFGFCFDVVPGGVKFERAPFKLTPEMVAVMGGSSQSQPFRAFEELCVKAFLASRQYVEQLAHVVLTMLDSGLPCFKPQTMKHFRERFVLEKSDREAAEFVRHLVHISERSYSTGVYDYYQLLTNGIPY